MSQVRATRQKNLRNTQNSTRQLKKTKQDIKNLWQSLALRVRRKDSIFGSYNTSKIHTFGKIQSLAATTHHESGAGWFDINQLDIKHQPRVRRNLATSTTLTIPLNQTIFLQD